MFESSNTSMRNGRVLQLLIGIYLACSLKQKSNFSTIKVIAVKATITIRVSFESVPNHWNRTYGHIPSYLTSRKVPWKRKRICLLWLVLLVQLLQCL